MPTTTVFIERVEIAPAVPGFRDTPCVLAQRGVIEDGKFRYLEPVNLLVGSIDASNLPEAVADAIGSINSSLQSQIAQLTAGITAANAAKQQAEDQLAAANEQITALQNRIAELTAEPDVPIVSRRQARLALLQMGLLDQVEQSVYSGPRGVQIEYEGDVWRRDNPTLVSLAEQLGMSSQQIDDFFQLAGTL